MYDAITDKLSRVDGDKLKLSYSEINLLIKQLYPQKQLPDHSYESTTWWANDQKSHTQSRSWLKAGWRTDMSQSKLGEYIIFVRKATGKTD
ncbi:DUF7662 domain-containing protein [Paenibacillus sp. FSL H3-0333]